jgi:hypothetical protein
VRVKSALAIAGSLTVLLAGCSGPEVDASCDVEGISHEVEHIIGESQLEMTSLDSLKCSGAWAFARATVSGVGQSAQSQPFLFEKTESGWFLKSPEIACGNDPGLPTVADELKADVCQSPTPNP